MHEKVRFLAERAEEMGGRLSVELARMRDELVLSGTVDEKDADTLAMNAGINQLAFLICVSMGAGKLSEDEFALVYSVFNRDLHVFVTNLMTKYAKRGSTALIEIEREAEEENGSP